MMKPSQHPFLLFLDDEVQKRSSPSPSPSPSSLKEDMTQLVGKSLESNTNKQAQTHTIQQQHPPHRPIQSRIVDLRNNVRETNAANNNWSMQKQYHHHHNQTTTRVDNGVTMQRRNGPSRFSQQIPSQMQEQHYHSQRHYCPPPRSGDHLPRDNVGYERCDFSRSTNTPYNRVSPTGYMLGRSTRSYNNATSLQDQVVGSEMPRRYYSGSYNSGRDSRMMQTYSHHHENQRRYTSYPSPTMRNSELRGEGSGQYEMNPPPPQFHTGARVNYVSTGKRSRESHGTTSSSEIQLSKRQTLHRPPSISPPSMITISTASEGTSSSRSWDEDDNSRGSSQYAQNSISRVVSASSSEEEASTGSTINDDITLRRGSSTLTQFTRTKPTRSNKSFDQHFKELVSFKAKYGHCDVSQCDKDHAALGRWCSLIRYSFKLMKRGEEEKTKNRYTLTSDNIRMLEDVGFSWSPARKVAFDKRYQELLKFKKEFGHCNVTKAMKEYTSLANWCINIRRNYRKMQEKNEDNAKVPGNLTPSNIKKLESIGFSWKTPISRPKKFDERFLELLEYKEKYGHCNVPRALSNTDYYSLAQWCNGIRTTYRLIQIGKSKNAPHKLTLPDIKKLEDVGFQWSIMKKKK